MRGEGNVLAELRKKLADKFSKDKIYQKIKFKNEKITYLTAKLGNEWTTNEIKDISELTKLIEKGYLTKDL
jgi:hypothetical protein